MPDDLDALATLPAHLDETLELALPRFTATLHTLARPSATIEPELARDSRGEAAIRGLGERDVTEGLTFDKTLGQGGMGIVRLAVQRSLGRHVAVKTLKEDARSDGARLRLLREAWITGALEHPNVIPVYDLGLDESGNPIIILKRVEGASWDTLRADAERMCAATGERSLERANLRVFLDVCRAVSLAHARGIVHRDLKPENVMIGAHGEVYVVDWGIAVAMRDDGTGRFPLAENAREMAGTPAYMAPEMLGGGVASRISERTDVYLLGATLHEIVSGRAPHDVGDMRAILSSILLSTPRLGPDVPGELAEVVARAMKRDPAERFASADDLRRAVESFMAHMQSFDLAEEARSHLDALEAALARPDLDPEAARPDVYRHFGACRFGYLEALRGWGDNRAAREDLRRAVTAMIRFELSAKAADAAASLLAELDDAPAELARAVDAAKAAAAAERARLEVLEHELDVKTGGRTRVFVAVALGIFWVLSPIALYAWGARAAIGHRELLASMVPSSGVAVALGAWARESLFKTPMNRRMVGMVSATLLATTVAIVGAWLAGASPPATGAFMVLVWGVSAAVAVPVVGRGFLPTPLLMGAAFLGAAARPDVWPLFASAANLVFTVNIAILWRDRVPWKNRDEPASRGRRRGSPA